jgi:hypothetical protein
LRLPMFTLKILSIETPPFFRNAHWIEGSNTEKRSAQISAWIFLNYN